MERFPPARAYAPEEAAAALGGDAPAGAWGGALYAAAACAPYLAHLIARRPEIAARIVAEGPEAVVAAAAADARAAGTLSFEEGAIRLRRAKAALHLACAVGDLSGRWTLDQVTGALTDFADAACQAALALSAAALAARGEFTLPSAEGANGPLPGFLMIAMGKQGARELNYSSDIDVTLFFDAATLPVAPGKEAKVAAQRVPPLLTRALSEQTEEGYVFRADFRLRPDPASTPVAVSVTAAEVYYQSVGQNWERAALIKARACAGDVAAGEEFLASLGSFIWRRHLDYAAIADIQSIKRQILSTHKGGDLDEAAPDVKLGRGGIRDIELFVQTQQLILGGRNKTLRARDTLGALAALEAAGVVDAAAREDLAAAYVFLRHVEHRIQMLHDEQTHRVPANPAMRARLAALCGFDAVEAFDAALRSHRQRTAAIDAQLFRDAGTLADPMGSLIFTGVEDDPETLVTLGKLGFPNPQHVSATVRGWHHGRMPATRTARARELLTALMPRLLRAIAQSGEPEIAFDRFDEFLRALPAGVQVFSLLQAQPGLLETAAVAFGIAPRLARELARRPALLDSIVDAHFNRPLSSDAPGALTRDLAARLAGASFEEALNLVRRFRAEEAFRIGMQVLARRATAAEAGVAHAALAQACVESLAAAAEQETVRRYGPAPGAFVIVALGKFGGAELAEGSDLDMMLVYDAPDGARTGELTAGEYYARLTQRLISALSAPTEEGVLYEVDMQLRPSGSKGPVAVRLSSFARYYREEAWTWELQALTRARVVCGDGALAAATMQAAREALGLPRDPRKLTADAAAMRARMDRERPGKGKWDLKLAPGGLVDIEFTVQALMLAECAAGRDAARANTGEAFRTLGDIGEDDRAAFLEAWLLFSNLTQVLRICVDEPFQPELASGRLRALLADIAGAHDFTDLEGLLTATQRDVRERFLRLVGAGGEA
ncbi:MAG: bifunctional [glutamine synthetase] adenylyltransferase/[glutamine synthetase]-adenylyl-L-tyrosine phosphorylase [Hyphomonadaceae bacterium]